MSLDQFTSGVKEKTEEFDQAMNTFSIIGVDQLVMEISLNEDNSMVWHGTVEGDSISFEMIYAGSYEMLSDNTIQFNINEETNRTTVYGVTRSETQDKSETHECSYLLGKNKLTFLNENGGSIGFRRS